MSDSALGLAPAAQVAHPDKNEHVVRVGIIVGSTRPGRKARTIAQWVQGQARGRPDATFEVVDLANYDLEHLDEPVPAVFGEYSQDHTRVWSTTISALDAFVVVVPEYNHSFPGALKTALDFLYQEWHGKAVGFVGYGVDGGRRAVSQLQQVTDELQLVNVAPQVALRLSTDVLDGHVVGKAAVDELDTVLDALLTPAGGRSRAGAS